MNDAHSRILTEEDVYLFREGRHVRLYEKLGAHLAHEHDTDGTRFAVWAPNARAVSVIGDFNGWNRHAHEMHPRQDGSGIWEAFVPEVGEGTLYKYVVRSQREGMELDKADPFAFAAEPSPGTASRVWDLGYEWHDAEWMESRRSRNGSDAPISIYEVHLGSWQRSDDGSFLGYREIAHRLGAYVRDLGFTHVELMPVTEHPFFGSWGYQTTGYFAATHRYGTPQDLMYLVDHLHQLGVGVILDWVPSHFANDAHGLALFDGTHLYEHEDPRRGFHPEWNSCIFDYGRREVCSFLASSALFWLDRYHVDGLRTDAVASMLYLDYAREPGEWIPNRRGGRENLEAIELLRTVNEAVYRDHPDVQMIAEESSDWPFVSRPAEDGGLGFGMKWNMGWMHDTLEYFREDPIHRRHHHNRLTFSIWYAFNENFLLPMSHDEVAHGKGSLLGKMPGDSWQQFANLRLLYGYMWAHPGKKLLFMGGEFGQRREWSHEESLDWQAVQSPEHGGMRQWVHDLNRCMREEPALHALDFDRDGFEWIDVDDSAHSIISFLRRDRSGDTILVVCNFTPVPRSNHRLGVPHGGHWREILNSDAPYYGGSGVGNFGAVTAAPVGANGRYHSLALNLPPLGAIFLKGSDKR